MAEIQQLSLVDSLSEKWLQLPFAAMRDVGPAVQALAGLLLTSKKETFSPISDIAASAGLPLKTCRNHFAELESGGWVVNDGRGRNEAGWTRRTCTIRVTDRTIKSLRQATNPEDGPTYGILPLWATNKFAQRNGSWKCLTWGARALLSLVVGRMAVVKNTIDPGIGMSEIDEDRFYAEWANMGEDKHFRLSLPTIEKSTGLSQRTAAAAKKCLHELGIITPCKSAKGDLLEPNARFLCTINPMSPNRTIVSLKPSEEGWQIWTPNPSKSGLRAPAILAFVS